MYEPKHIDFSLSFYPNAERTRRWDTKAAMPVAEGRLICVGLVWITLTRLNLPVRSSPTVIREQQRPLLFTVCGCTNLQALANKIIEKHVLWSRLIYLNFLFFIMNVLFLIWAKEMGNRLKLRTLCGQFQLHVKSLDLSPILGFCVDLKLSVTLFSFNKKDAKTALLINKKWFHYKRYHWFPEADYF